MIISDIRIGPFWIRWLIERSTENDDSECEIVLSVLISGLFQAGRINGVPFLKNKASGRYLAINCSGQVYTRVRLKHQ